jgi:hypothetical protein
MYRTWSAWVWKTQRELDHAHSVLPPTPGRAEARGVVGEKKHRMAHLAGREAIGGLRSDHSPVRPAGKGDLHE